MLGFAKKNTSAQSKDSGSIALGRLKMVLTADRVEGSAQMLEMMKNDILDVMRKYIDIDEKDLDIQICQQANDGAPTESRLKADIPIRNVRRRR